MSWHLNDLTLATGAPAGGWTPSGYVFEAQGTQHVTYVGTDFHINELLWDSNGWHHNDLTAVTSSPESNSAPVGYVFSGTQHVNYLGVDNHIQELWWDGGGWHHRDLTSTVGGGSAPYAEPRGYAFETQGTQHVIYMDDSGHVVELYWMP